MKLKDWADKTGVKYLTAYRWFKAGTLPVKAYQTDSGTIIVEDDAIETNQNNNNNSPDVMTLFLKKTIEYSQNKSSIEDFAGYILTNFTLKLNVSENPKYSRNKPKPEEVQKHFKKFLPNNTKPTPNIFIPDAQVWETISENSEDFVGTNGESQGLVNQIRENDEGALVTNSSGNLGKISGEVGEDLQKTLASLIGGASTDTYCVSNANASFLVGDSPVFNGTLTTTDLNPKNYTYSVHSVTNTGDNTLGESPVFVNFYNAINSSAVGLNVTDKPKRGRPRKKTNE